MAHPLIQDEIDDAADAAERLAGALTTKDAMRAWREFLASSNRAINKLQKFAERTNQKKKFSQLFKSIWENDLTKYMRSARNDREHGLEPLAIADPHGDRLKIAGTLTRMTVLGQNSDGKWSVHP